MKIAIITLIAIAGICSAQEKLWTWKPKNEAAEHVLHASAMNERGEAVLVMAEITGDSGAWLIVWLDAKGKARMSKRIPSDDESITLKGIKTEWDAWPVRKWTANFLGNHSIVIAGLGSTRIYTARDDSSVSVKIVDGGNEMFFPTTGFVGWLKLDAHDRSVTVAGAGANGDPAKLPYKDVKSFSAWRP